MFPRTLGGADPEEIGAAQSGILSAMESMRKRAEPPPEPRRRPRQSRSQETVDAIIEACLQMLEQEGPDHLTTNGIAERAGVSKGSLYQYFPDKHAIVAAAFDRLVSADVGLHEQSSEEWAGLSLEDSVAVLVDRMLEQDRRLVRLHRAFYQTYHRNYDVGAEWQRIRGDADLIVGIVRDRLVEHQHRLRTQNVDTAAFLLARGLRGIVWKIVEERPEHLGSDELRDELVSLFQSYLIRPPVE